MSYNFNNAEKLEEISSGEFIKDTRKVLNRSDAKIPDSLIAEIESGITSERLIELDLPIFYYGGQITIHGDFPEMSDKLRIGGYKWVFQNQNKSIGIKYQAIDYKKKEKIILACKTLGKYSADISSTGFKITTYKEVSNKEEYLSTAAEYMAKIESLKPIKIYGSYSCWLGSLFGTKFMVFDIIINAIPESSLWPFITKLTGFTEQSLNNTIKKRDEEYKKYWEEKRKIDEANEKIKDRATFDFIKSFISGRKLEKIMLDGKCYFRFANTPVGFRLFIYKKQNGKIWEYRNYPLSGETVGFHSGNFNLKMPNTRSRKELITDKSFQNLTDALEKDGVYEILEDEKYLQGGTVELLKNPGDDESEELNED